MAKFVCVCGTVISTRGEIPNPNQWLMVSDIDFDAMSGLLEAEVIYRSATLAFRCPASDHLWVYWEGFDRPPRLYAPAPGAERGAPEPPD